MTDEEICKIMDWEYRNPDYKDDSHILKRIRKVVEEAQKQEREAIIDLLTENWYKTQNDCIEAIRNRT